MLIGAWGPLLLPNSGRQVSSYVDSTLNTNVCAFKDDMQSLAKELRVGNPHHSHSTRSLSRSLAHTPTWPRTRSLLLVCSGLFLFNLLLSQLLPIGSLARVLSVRHHFGLHHDILLLATLEEVEV